MVQTNVIAAGREPLLWLQLLGAAVLPLEALLALLLLAGTDPGPVPPLERLLAWAIGALAPAMLLWNRPADPFSLLLIQAPLRGRSVAQRTLLAVPSGPARWAAALAAALLLPGLWWLDRLAALAGPIAPFPDAGRLVSLLLAVPLLAVVVWQLQQLCQAISLLLRSPAGLEGLLPRSLEQVAAERLSLGLPLLLLDPLGTSAAARPVAVEPQQPAEDHDGGDLDQQVD